MALGNGQKWALYLLMGQHSNTVDGKSHFRTTVEANTPPGTDYKPAFVAAAQALDGAGGIDGNDIGNMPNLDRLTIRNALAMDPYPEGAGPCPDAGHEGTIYSTLSQNWL